MCLPRLLVIRSTKAHLNTRYKQGHRLWPHADLPCLVNLFHKKDSNSTQV